MEEQGEGGKERGGVADKTPTMYETNIVNSLHLFSTSPRHIFRILRYEASFFYFLNSMKIPCNF